MLGKKCVSISREIYKAKIGMVHINIEKIIKNDDASNDAQEDDEEQQ
jgi:hypothetical protein